MSGHAGGGGRALGHPPHLEEELGLAAHEGLVRVGADLGPLLNLPEAVPGTAQRARATTKGARLLER